MNTLKHGVIAASLAFATSLALGNENPKLADPATMTDDEKATVQLLNDYRACTRQGIKENAAKAPEIEAKADEIAAARSDAAAQATREAAIKIGMLPEHAEHLIEAMKGTDAHTIRMALLSLLPDPGETCLKKLNIDDPNAADKKLGAIIEKYGRDVLAPKLQ